MGFTLQKLLQHCSPELQSPLSIIFGITELLSGIHVEEEEKSGYLSCLHLGACILSFKGANIKVVSAIVCCLVIGLVQVRTVCH